jgi:hypothetical protein
VINITDGGWFLTLDDRPVYISCVEGNRWFGSLPGVRCQSEFDLWGREIKTWHGHVKRDPLIPHKNDLYKRFDAPFMMRLKKAIFS